MKTKKNTKAKVNHAALEEPILEWILRECPEEKRAAEDFPGGITFAEAYESLKAGWGLGGAENCETALREKVWRGLAEILGENVDALADFAEECANARERREARR